MRRDDPQVGKPGADAHGDGLSPSLRAAVLLADSVRRRIFQFVRRAGRPVTRDEAAVSARVSRNLAAFHLDRLVEAGLLRAGTRPAAARAVGRRPKVYEPGPVEVHLDIPPRQHGLLAGVLVKAVTAADGPHGGGRTAAEVARQRGTDIGRAARTQAGGDPGPVDARAVLERLGFEPYDAGPAVLRLRNCPFQPMAAESPELVCGLNLALIEGLIEGLQADGVGVALAPREGDCCVEVRTGPPGVPASGPAESDRDASEQPG